MNEFKNKNLRRVGLFLVVIYMAMGCLVPPMIATMMMRMGNPIIGWFLLGLWAITLILFLIVAFFA
jgi:uncharacterized membrane protein YfbV (UPF0208 family)